MTKAITLTYLVKVSAANVNASHTEGNVLTIKKITLPDGSTLPYISGQAVRRMLRDRLDDLGYTLSEPFSKVSGQEVTPPAQPDQYIDEDLFGYMDASGSKRRTSPTRVSALVGLYPFWGDRDLGTRSFEKFGREVREGGNLFETELYDNLFRGTMLIETDRVGRFPKAELGKDAADGALSDAQRKERLKALIHALRLLWGGGRTARMLTDLTPRFIAYARLKVKTPLFLEAVRTTYEQGQSTLLIEPIQHAVARLPKEWCETLIFGYEPGFFANESELQTQLDAIPLSEAYERILNDIGAMTL